WGDLCGARLSRWQRACQLARGRKRVDAISKLTGKTCKHSFFKLSAELQVHTDGFRFLRFTGTALRYDAGSGVPLRQPDSQRGPGVAQTWNCGHPGIFDVNCRPGNGQDHAAVSTVRRIARQYANRALVPDPM